MAEDPTSSIGDRLRAIHEAKRVDDLQRLREQRADRSLYATHGVPRLRLSLVTYLDTLGTKTRSSSLTNVDLRSDIDENDEYQSRLHSRFWDEATQRMVTFSDNVCVAAPVEGQDVAVVLRNQIDAAAGFQFSRVLSGRAIRGGITMGEVYCDSNYVDGPALVRAVEIEETLATVPRVLVEDGAATEVRTGWSGQTDPWPFKLVALDSDGRLFVNYLHASGPHTTTLDQRVDMHASLVRQQLAAAPSPKVKGKWQWVARYHNWFVAEFLPGRSDLVVRRYSPQACSLL